MSCQYALAGPYFGNVAGTIVHSGEYADVTIEATDGDANLVRLAHLQLAGEKPAAAVAQGQWSTQRWPARKAGRP